MSADLAMKTERLTPLDLLMPRTYVGALLTFRTTASTTFAYKGLQEGLEKLVKQLPWLSGRVVPITIRREGSDTSKPWLEVQWNMSQTVPQIQDKGSIQGSYEELAAQGMPPNSIPKHVWPVPSMIDNASFNAGVPVFGASIFQFADGQGLGLCISVHHNVVDATGFAEIVKLWAGCITGETMASSSIDLDRLSLDRSNRLSDALSSELEEISGQPTDILLKSHPTLSRVPPALPTEFPACTTKIFKIPIAQIETMKERLRSHMPNIPTTNTIVCALLWSSITHARRHRQVETTHKTSRLVIAVDSRRRTKLICSSTPYFGNAVVYSLAEVGLEDLESPHHLRSLAQVCQGISQSLSSDQINTRSVAGVYSLVDRSDDYSLIFPGWDLFHSRDLTITSWADLDLYSGFGAPLGTPQFIRVPYTEADGVCMVMPRRKKVAEEIEIVVILRGDDMGEVDLKAI